MNRKISKAVLSLSALMATPALPAAAFSLAASPQPAVDSARAHLTVLYERAHPESPARFRLIEELDRLSRPGPTEDAR